VIAEGKILIMWVRRISNRERLLLAVLTVCDPVIDFPIVDRAYGHSDGIRRIADVCVKGKERVQYTYSLITSGSWLVSTLKEQ